MTRNARLREARTSDAWRYGVALGLLVLLVSAALAGTPGGALAADAKSAVTTPQLHVSGNELVNARGQRVILRGVNRAGGEWACIDGTGIWDGPMNQASVTAMKGWHINAVRVPLNEACWNGQSYVARADRGTAYRRAVRAYVSLLNRNGMVAILDLSYTDGKYTGTSSACASAQARCEKPMPDRAQAVPFWKSVASTFRDNDAVIFDVFNEPFPEAATGSPTAWNCWLRGGKCKGIGYQVAGMQDLVNAVRSTGANNVIMLGGIHWGNDLSQWLQHAPDDPANNLAASWHTYNFTPCASSTCWNKRIAPVLAQAPVIAGEIGENDCRATFIDKLMTWLDARSASYLAWGWNADYACAAGPSLITSYGGAATAYGAAFRKHLRSLRG